MSAQERAAVQRQLLDARRRLRGGMITWITRWFAAAESFRDADQTTFVDQFTPVALAAQQASAMLTWSYLDQMLADMTGDRRPPAPLDVDTVSGTALRGVAPETVYARPYAEIWRVLAAEKTRQEAGEAVDDSVARPDVAQPLTKAVAAGERRAKLIGLTDLELAEREATRQLLTSDPRAPRYYRRVLTGDESCGMCVIASTQRYRSEELLPIHPGCDCVVEPLPDGARHVVDRQLLAEAHDAIQARFGVSDRAGRAIDYRKILLVRDHGELGPTLTVAKHRFTGPGELPELPEQRSRRRPRRDPEPAAATPDVEPEDVTPAGVPEPRESSEPSGSSVAALAEREPVSTRRLGGSTAYTDLVEYEDGSKLIHKVNGSRATSIGFDPVEITDAEILGARVLDVLGLRTAELHRSGDAELYMEYVDGRVGGEAYSWADELPQELLDTDEARRLGLADYYQIQGDRNPGNWIVDTSDRLVGIDNGGSWLEGTTVDWPTSSPFARWLYQPDAPRKLAERIDISADDLAEARRRIEGLREEFEQAGRLDWWELTMQRHLVLEQRAIADSTGGLF